MTTDKHYNLLIKNNWRYHNDTLDRFYDKIDQNHYRICYRYKHEHDIILILDESFSVHTREHEGESIDYTYEK